MKEIPYDELLGWYAYFERRPIGWREDDRTSKLLQGAGVKAKPTDLFPSLKAIYTASKEPAEGDDQSQMIMNSTFYQMMLTAQGGEKFELESLVASEENSTTESES